MLYVECFIVNPAQENTYIVYNELGNALIIDPGCYFENEKKLLLDCIEKHKLNVVQLINTHCHLDHVLGNKWVAEKFELELYIHAAEEEMLKLAPLYSEQWGLPFDNYEGVLHFLEDGDTIYLDNESFQIIHTPGHSAGSISFYSSLGGFVISGDVLFKGSIGRTDLHKGDYSTLIDSIKSKLLVLPNDTIVYSGHGAKTTIGLEKLTNPFLVE